MAKHLKILSVILPSKKAIGFEISNDGAYIVKQVLAPWAYIAHDMRAKFARVEAIRI